MRGNLSLVATVISTISFQALINPPGGFISQVLLSCLLVEFLSSIKLFFGCYPLDWISWLDCAVHHFAISVLAMEEELDEDIQASDVTLYLNRIVHEDA
ncbi:hypothetical protein QN277_022324 [Acacia crassicarpa]|uniref:PGG domain-containing protein n=1 Tax=Acacia crassicarpa TaxID=499986 RepID=A0AAE1JEQ1_9FABA|nr:hypothetical protein QN277_022324 [Acacia crassicarpa]